jgi:hypothetical protein
LTLLARTRIDRRLGRDEAATNLESLMIRTTLSFCLLFGGLLLASKWMHQSTPATSTSQPEQAVAQPPASERPAPQPLEHQTRLIPAAAPTAAEIQLVAFDDPLTDVLQNLRQGHAPRGRVADDLADELGNDITVEPRRIDNSSTELGTVPAASPPTEPEIALTPELLDLRTRLRECLAYYYFRPENVALRSPWGAMHAMIAYGVDSELIAGDKRVNAIGYLNYNGVCNGQQLFYTTNGKLQARIGPGVQGHAGQYLAMLAQSRVKTDFPMLVEGQRFTVADLIQYEKETCRPKTELTFKLIAFMHYLKSDEKWKSDDGQDWDIPRLIKEELAQPIVGAACGGTHRMTGFSYAVRKREQRGEPFTGQWLRAQKFVEDFHEYTFRLQNPDGSFSTIWFAGRGDDGPPTKRLETTGHITEWLAYSLDKEQLVEPRMIKSVSYLTNLLTEHKDEKWGIGPLGHGLHALAIYDERIFGGKPGERAIELAEAKKLRRALER